jgi:hypothetical protein
MVMFEPVLTTEIVRGGESLGATGVKPHFIFGDKNKGELIFEKSSYTLGRRLTTYATYDRPHLRSQKNEQINNKPGCATENTHNPGEEAHRLREA